MTTPAVAARTGGRTSQGRGSAPDRTEPGRILGGASSPGRTRTAWPSTKPASQGRQASASPRGPSAKTQQRQTRARQRQISINAVQGSRALAVPAATDWQKVIAAEFILAELLIALTPMTSKKQATDVSPYVPRDMTKMIAVGAVFFLLELLSIPAGWGRGMAAFGGLILLAVGLNEGANVARDIDAFAGIKTAAAKVKEKVTDA